MNVYANSRYPSTLPETLRLRPGGLTPQQLRVYEDFMRLPRPEIDRGRPRDAKSDAPLSAEDNDNGPLLVPKVMEKFLAIVEDLKNVVANYPAEEDPQGILANLDVQSLIKQIRVITVRSVIREEAAINISQKLVSLLLETTSEVERIVYAFTLEKILELSNKTIKEVNSWFIYANDERKFNVDVYRILLKAGVLNIVDVDAFLARLIDSGSATDKDFVLKFLAESTLTENASFSIHEFFLTYGVMRKMVVLNQANEQVASTVDVMKSKLNYSINFEDSSMLRDQLINIFGDWIRTSTHPASNEFIQTSFIRHLLQQKILQVDDVSALFFRVCTEVTIERCLENLNNPAIPLNMAYTQVDALSKFIIVLVKNIPPTETGSFSRVNLFTKILSIILLVLVNTHELLKVDFNQKPFYRLFSSLLTDIHNEEEALKAVHLPMMSAFWYSICSLY
jgi:CCR4-NOT transcription complex subunit 1